MGQGPVRLGGDGGYRMAKAYVTPGGETFLFFGGLATGSPGRPSAASLIAIDRATSRNGSAGMVRPFSAVAERLISIRAIAEHDGKLFWATEDMKDPKTSLGPAVSTPPTRSRTSARASPSGRSRYLRRGCCAGVPRSWTW